MGIIGRGKTIPAAFEAAAMAVFAIMSPLSLVKLNESIKIEFEERDIELALVTWLNLLIGEAHSRNWILAKFHLDQQNSHWIGQAWGEPWRNDLEHGTEVKGATLTALSVQQINGEWEARCVVDV